MVHSASVVWKNSTAIRRRVILEMKLRLNPGFKLKTEQIFKRNVYDRDQQRWREIHNFEIPYA